MTVPVGPVAAMRIASSSGVSGDGSLELSKPAISQDGPEGTVVYVPVDHVAYGTGGVWPSHGA